MSNFTLFPWVLTLVEVEISFDKKYIHINHICSYRVVEQVTLSCPVSIDRRGDNIKSVLVSATFMCCFNICT